MDWRYFVGVLVLGVFIGFGATKLKTHFIDLPLIEYGEFEAYLEATPNNTLKIYGTSWCSFCSSLMLYLEKENIQYQFIDVEISAIGKMEFKELKGSGYPLIITSNALLRGFDETTLRRFLVEQKFIVE